MITGFLDQLQIFLTFVTIRIARTRNRSGTAGAAALIIFKAFDRILHLVFLTTQVLQI